MTSCDPALTNAGWCQVFGWTFSLELICDRDKLSDIDAIPFSLFFFLIKIDIVNEYKWNVRVGGGVGKTFLIIGKFKGGYNPFFIHFPFE